MTLLKPYSNASNQRKPRAARLVWPLMLVLAAQASAQSDADSEEPLEIRRYVVELIVFGYNENVSVGTEVFPPDPLPELVVETDEALLEEEPIEDDRVEDDLENETDLERLIRLGDERVETVFLSRDDLTLQNAYSHMRRLDVYEPWMHVGWIQAGLPKELAIPLDVNTLGNPPSELSGEFTLYLGNYLHLVVDLEVDAPDQPGYDPSAFDRGADAYEDSRLPYADERRLQTGPVIYRIDEDRIVKIDETRYYDHPKFGVIAKITRFEAPELETDEDYLLPPLTSQAGQ